jgi:hypothetical protein
MRTTRVCGKIEGRSISIYTWREQNYRKIQFLETVCGSKKAVKFKPSGKCMGCISNGELENRIKASRPGRHQHFLYMVMCTCEV